MKRDWAAGRRKVDREKRCRVCARFGDIEAAHIIPRSLGGRMEEDSFVPLCPKCHRLYDGGKLDLLSYLDPGKALHREQAEAVLVVGIEAARKRITNDYPPEAA